MSLTIEAIGGFAKVAENAREANLAQSGRFDSFFAKDLTEKISGRRKETCVNEFESLLSVHSIARRSNSIYLRTEILK